MKTIKQISVILCLSLFVSGISITELEAASKVPAPYSPLEKVHLDASKWDNIVIPYQLKSQTTSYSWEFSVANIQNLPGRCGSFIGAYDHSSKRSGYFYSDSSHTGGTADKPNYQVCVGTKHRDTVYNLGGVSDVNTIKASYTHSGPGGSGTYNVSDTLGLIGTSVDGTWDGDYCLNSNFSVVACARYNYGVDPVSAYEFVSLDFYGLKITEKDTSGKDVLKVDLYPAKDSDGVLGVYDAISEEFIPIIRYSTVVKVDFDKDGGTGGTDFAGKVREGMPIDSIEPPSKPGFEFGGYFTEPDGKGIEIFDKDGKAVVDSPFKKDTTLHAYWINLVPSPATSDNNSIVLLISIILLSIISSLIIRRRFV